MIRHPSHNQPKQRSHGPCYVSTQESPAACLSSLVLLRRVQTLLHSQADSVRRRGRVRMSTQLGRSAVENTTKTDRFRPLSPMFPSAHLSAQKMSQTNSVSTCVSFTRCTGARVHGPDRTWDRSWDGSWEVRNWHPDDLATPTLANTSTHYFGASTRLRKRMPRMPRATPPPPVEHRRSEFEELVRTQFSTNRTDRMHPIVGANQAWHPKRSGSTERHVHSKPRGREDARCPITKPLATQSLWPGSV